MDTRSAIIRMLRQLLEDSVVLHQQGAGYYSCLPIIHRYNKLLTQGLHALPDCQRLLRRPVLGKR